MFTNNPYAHARWPNANQNAVNISRNAPSVFGALPFSGPSSRAAVLAFIFVNFTSNIMNCIVTSPGGKPYYCTTDDPASGFTIIQGFTGQSVALIEWRTVPIIEIYGLVARQPISQWVALSPQKDRLFMGTNDVSSRKSSTSSELSYATSQLYSVTNTSTLLARITKHTTVQLEISTNSIHAGLPDVCVAATMLLLCGQPLD
ncbi:hypothetical protein BDN71DRAFT_94559 [Pleurotus eryngii]|uniref:Uncharacterized protein n=1 Tax=Pleurotus eryngii TaxID=5323 RepID=A0A9P6D4V9_PLEER|nr:hypothetical protein BDN71DRAFT_94559 [Pleurotus eryngii]